MTKNMAQAQRTDGSSWFRKLISGGGAGTAGRRRWVDYAFLGAFFLLLLLAVLAVLLPFCVPVPTLWGRISLWPQRLWQAWSQSRWAERILALAAIAGLAAGLAGLIRPYYQVSVIYRFSRSWAEVSLMLPRPQSYLLAEHSQLWNFSANLFTGLPGRQEHQLFPGLALLVLILAGLLGRFNTGLRRLAWLNLAAAGVLVALTLNINGVSIYHALWQIRGMNSLRAVTRITLA